MSKTQSDREPLGAAAWFSQLELDRMHDSIEADRKRPEWLRRLRQAIDIIRYGCIDED